MEVVRTRDNDTIEVKKRETESYLKVIYRPATYNLRGHDSYVALATVACKKEFDITKFTHSLIALQLT